MATSESNSNGAAKTLAPVFLGSRVYHEGGDVEPPLPALSTYLGHTGVRDSYWYLSACPELMEAAARRLDRRWEAMP
jgi:hypothetical protein